MSDDKEVGPARRVKRKYEPVSPEGKALQEAEQNGGGITGGVEQELQTRAAVPLPTMVGPQTEEEDETLLTRRARGVDGDTRLDVPDEYKREGWDYEYKTQRINGADVDSSDTAQIYEAGWRPVLAKSMPKLNPPGYTGKYVSRLGQILYTRPMSLTDEANAESFKLAEDQKFDKLMAASAVPTSRPGMIVPTKSELSIEGVVGTHRAAPKGAAA